MNRVDAAVIRDLRKATAAFQARTLEMLLTALPAERPMSEANRNIPPATSLLPTPTPPKGQP